MENAAKIGTVVAFEGEKLAKQVSERISHAADTAGQSLDEALDHVWRDLKRTVLDYTRKEPVNALLIAFGAGVLLGWAFKKDKE